MTNNKNEIMSITEEFYEELYTSEAETPPTQIKSKTTNVGQEENPVIEIDEVKEAFISELIKYRGKILIKKLKILLNKCLVKSTIPKT